MKINRRNIVSSLIIIAFCFLLNACTLADLATIGSIGIDWMADAEKKQEQEKMLKQLQQGREYYDPEKGLYYQFNERGEKIYYSHDK